VIREVAAVALVAVACSGDREPLPDVRGGQTLQVDAAFAGDEIPSVHTCDGSDSVPVLSWSPAEADSYAIVVTDPDAPGGTFVHWVAWDIPGEATSIDATTESTEGTNDFGDEGYGGPCPPEGDDAHRYRFTIYALSGTPTADLEAGATADELLEAIRCCVSARGSTTATYAR
jgi:Raf kinase inhibitor-like YbhB/YbcL family protein